MNPDLNTRLPPRKRHLAGARISDPVSPMSIQSRLRDLFNSAYTSQEEMIEASRATALAAAEMAARARETAVEKAEAAAVARAAARRALEVMDSVARIRARKERAVLKRKGKGKHVAVEHLYKKRPAEAGESDSELSRRLQRARIVDEKSLVSSEKVGVHPKLVRGVKDRGTVGTKKVKSKRKRLLVSQCGFKDQSEEQRLEGVERRAVLGSPKPAPGGGMEKKVSSVLSCKKFKVPVHSTDRKMSHTLISDSTARTASMMVEVD